MILHAFVYIFICVTNDEENDDKSQKEL